MNTSVARRSLGGWVSRYLSSKVRGTLDLGQLESLSTTRFVLRNAVIYDQQHRRVATINRLFAESNLFGALYRSITKDEPFTLIVESVRADGVHLRLHPAQAGGGASL
ncbi:MAG TPA: hypothetical protein VKP30_03625, partial [Polyangiaceae bacterium]|nr:hypothetical protein [Polyangiaceae bacterium]